MHQPVFMLIAGLLAVALSVRLPVFWRRDPDPAWLKALWLALVPVFLAFLVCKGLDVRGQEGGRTAWVEQTLLSAFAVVVVASWATSFFRRLRAGHRENRRPGAS